MYPHTTLHGGVYYPHSTNHRNHPPSQTGLIVGIVFAVVGSLLVIGVGWFMVVRHRKKEKAQGAEFEPSIHASFRVSSDEAGDEKSREEHGSLQEYPHASSTHLELSPGPSIRSVAPSQSPPHASVHSTTLSHSSTHSMVPSNSSTHSMVPSHSSLNSMAPSYSSIHSMVPSHLSVHSLVPSHVSTGPIATPFSSALSPTHPAMTVLSQSQPTPRQSSETARGSFDCPPWSRDSRFQEFF